MKQDSNYKQDEIFYSSIIPNCFFSATKHYFSPNTGFKHLRFNHLFEDNWKTKKR